MILKTARRIRLGHVSFFQSKFWLSFGPNSSNRVSWNKKVKRMTIRMKLVVMLKMMRELNPLFRSKVPLQTLGIKPPTLKKDK